MGRVASDLLYEREYRLGRDLEEEEEEGRIISECETGA